MLTFVGLGLCDEKDISIRGYEAVRDADVVFAEFYTSRLIRADIKKLENFFGKRITVLPRESVEDGKEILRVAQDKNVVLLVAGDPLVATTHISLRMMAERMGIKTNVIHAASIFTAAPAHLGLQHYKFGRTVSIPFPQKNYFPTSAYDFIAENKKRGLHTLILLDLNPRPMTANEAIEILFKMEEQKEEKIITPSTLIAVASRIGSPDASVKAGYAKDMINEDFGPPLHTLVLPGKLHFAEAEALVYFAGAPREILDDL